MDNKLMESCVGNFKMMIETAHLLADGDLSPQLREVGEIANSEFTNWFNSEAKELRKQGYGDELENKCMEIIMDMERENFKRLLKKGGIA